MEQDIIDWQRYFAILKDWAIVHGLKIIVVLIVAFLAIKIFGALINRFVRLLNRRHEDDSEYQKRTQTLSSVSHYAVDIVVILVAGMIVLRESGIDIGPILAAAGVVGLAVGFGAQSLVKDVIGGFFILMEDQIRVGDVVEIAGKSGVVEQVTLRMVVLRDLHGHVHYVTNGQIDTVTNMTKDFSRYVFDIGVAYREDVDEVIKVIEQVDEDLRSDPEFGTLILEPIEVLGLNEFADSAVVIKARTKTKPIEQWRVGREFNRRLKKKFDEVGIEIPFPHVTLYAGQDKQGKAPPLNISMPDNREESGG